MKKWPFIVAGLYGVMLVVLFFPLIMVAFFKEISLSDVRGMLGSAQLWIPVGLMVLAQVALLRIPVGMTSGRPVNRRPVIVTISAAAFMMGVLILGAVSCLYELIAKSSQGLEWAIAAGVASWLFWSIYFYYSTKSAEPHQIMNQLQKFLWSGSILEFLIAVPTHIIARQRDYCCAGIMTFIGLACGISVMLFAFGPALFFLFVERWRRLHPNP